MRKSLILVSALLALASCKKESYDSGDGELSYMRADFVEAHTRAVRQMDYAITDDGDRVMFSSDIYCGWAQKEDSLYRALLYYKRADGESQSDPVAVSRVPVLTFGMPSDTVRVVTDPVTFESAWLSSNGKYLNVGFALKTGVPDSGDSKQIIGVVCESIDTLASGNMVYHLTFYHDQNDVPEYYSSRSFASIPTQGMRSGDNIVLSLNSYDGLIEKRFAVSR